MEGIDKLFITGTNAWFYLKEGASLTEEQVKAAVEGQRLGFISFGEMELPASASAWVIPSGFG